MNTMQIALKLLFFYMGK